MLKFMILQHIDKIRIKLLQECYLCHNTSLAHAILKVFIILMLKSIGMQSYFDNNDI